MQYKYCPNEDFGHLSSGQVLFNKSGLSNFPVRLAQEIYNRCLYYSRKKDNICIYDPCCGGGYLLTALGFMNPNTLRTIIGSDINEDALNIAKKNLTLLTDDGLKDRYDHLKNLYDLFNKTSHLQAMESAKILSGMLDLYNIKPSTSVFQADILSNESIGNLDFFADIVLTDVPYGELISWQGNNACAINVLMDNIIKILKPASIVAICSNKQQKIVNDKYFRLEKQQIGKRKFEIFALR